jgi:type I restriction enzyme, S subunit
MPPAQFDIAWEDLRNLIVRVPPLEAQRAIADYLDLETRRIDIALDLRRRTIALLDEKTSAVLNAAFASASTRRTRLKHLLAQSPCYGVLVPSFVDVGVPFVRVGDLASMGSDDAPARYISESQSHEYARTRLVSGDVLLSVVGSIDKVHVVSSALVGSNIARAVCRLVPRAGVPSDLLALWFGTKAYLDQARQATSSDTAQPTLGMGDLANFEVWVPGPNAYDEFRTFLRQKLDSLAAARNSLQRQIDLLAERRHALITAAVTGQLDIPGVAA